MDPIMSLANAHQLVVIEDAACALGTWINGRHAGTIGDFGTFSFHPRKTITTGEGGMVLANTDVPHYTRCEITASIPMASWKPLALTTLRSTGRPRCRTNGFAIRLQTLDGTQHAIYPCLVRF